MAQAYTFTPLNFERLSREEQLQQSHDFFDSMKRRRTVREYSTETVPIELIQNAVATAGTAPSGANQQPWTFVVISNPELKRKIREAAEIEEKDSYENRMSDEWLEALAPLGTDWHKPHLEDAPYLIVIFKQAFGLRADGSKLKHYYVDESVGIATGLLLASLHQAGLATLTHTPSPMKFLAEILERPDNERAIMIIAVGYPAADAEVPDISKKSLQKIMVHFD
ncbi:MAG: nitroreductase family protein [Anaerolineae bacterium]|nr:nitroreductase family protein [Anaerolineae bacterium]MDQ7033332.1 nitroreductase family protein [Anaerolineae bacterium]